MYTYIQAYITYRLIGYTSRYICIAVNVYMCIKMALAQAACDDQLVRFVHYHFCFCCFFVGVFGHMYAYIYICMYVWHKCLYVFIISC